MFTIRERAVSPGFAWAFCSRVLIVSMGALENGPIAPETRPIKDVCRQHNITEQTLYRWRNKYGGMDVAEARRLKELESENAKLKRMVAE